MCHSVYKISSAQRTNNSNDLVSKLQFKFFKLRALPSVAAFTFFNSLISYRDREWAEMQYLMIAENLKMFGVNYFLIQVM